MQPAVRSAPLLVLTILAGTHLSRLNARNAFSSDEAMIQLWHFDTTVGSEIKDVIGTNTGELLLGNRTPHASFDSKTNRVRWSMDLRYQSAALPTNA
jgi:hypothetical protein